MPTLPCHSKKQGSDVWPHLGLECQDWWRVGALLSYVMCCDLNLYISSARPLFTVVAWCHLCQYFFSTTVNWSHSSVSRVCYGWHLCSADISGEYPIILLWKSLQGTKCKIHLTFCLRMGISHHIPGCSMSVRGLCICPIVLPAESVASTACSSIWWSPTDCGIPSESTRQWSLWEYIRTFPSWMSKRGESIVWKGLSG